MNMKLNFRRMILGGILCLLPAAGGMLPDAYAQQQKPGDKRLSLEQGQEKLAPIPNVVDAEGMPATHANMKYGVHERNVLDIWLATSDAPTPLVVYIHGGGYTVGDKSWAHKYESENLAAFLAEGISLASINYRFYNQAPNGVLGCLQDAARALQFLRSKADTLNIDPARVGCYGPSAGAGTALWLAFHDNMAAPHNSDPVLRESTRVKVAGVQKGPATLNVMRWPEILGMAVDPKIIDQGAVARGFYGSISLEALDSGKGAALRAELDMLGMMSKGDPPLWVLNGEPNAVTPDLSNLGHLYHHPLHAAVLGKQADELGIENQVTVPALGIAPPEDQRETLVEFFVRHLD